MEPTFSHFGICVSDLEVSLRFYCEALGFRKAESHEIGTEFAALMDFEDVAVTSQFIRKGTTAIELLSFSEPEPFGDKERRPVNQLGLTHLSFRVSDVEAVAAQVVELGGSRVASSRTTIDFAGTPLEFVYCTDPDGVRIELMDLGG
jgi:catechol 2,3-dioxygenase-like lactoylglutathione lyase family enzyme